MRPGLVILGTAIACIGAGLVISVFVLSGGGTITNRSSVEIPSLSPHTVWPEAISRSTSTTGSIGLSWTSSAPANVSLWPASACSGPLGYCAIGPPAFNWTLAVSGKGTDSSATASTYILEVTNPSGASLKFSAVVSLSYSPGSPLPSWSWGLIVLGGVTLLVIGGIAVFLGLFLPGGVYREPSAGTVARRPPSEPPDEPGSGTGPSSP